MSSPPGVHRLDRLMAQDKALEFLKAGFAGRLATVSDDGSPYCLPLLYVWMDDRLLFHNTIARGHLRALMSIMSAGSASSSMNLSRSSIMAGLNAIQAWLTEA
jgi:Pyridoxamine 5'-phosphate oxidase